MRSTKTLTFLVLVLSAIHAPALAQLLEQQVRPDGIELSDRFGNSLDAEAGRFVAGAIYEGVAGGAHVFRRVGGEWVEESALAPGDGGGQDWFGDDVALSVDTVVVGSPNHDQPIVGAGAAYVYRRTGPGWTLEQKLTANPPTLFASFGARVAIDGDRIVVAARLESPGGALYVFERSGTSWAQTARIEPAGLQDDDYLGLDVALDGDTILAGAFGVDGAGGGELTGAAFVFRELAGSWIQEAAFAVPTTGDANFGFSVALDGERAAIGAPAQCCGAPLEGKVYVFERAGSAWSFTAELRAPGGLPAETFGYALDLEGDRLLVGAQREALVADDSGAVYVYEHDGSSWKPDLRWTGLGSVALDDYGEAVALDGPRFLSGASGVDAPLQGGAVYVVELGPDAAHYCFCASGAPCSNGVGFGGCATATGAGGLLLAYGSASVTEDDLVLRAFDTEPGRAALVAVGRATQQIPYGDGQLCIAPGSASSLARFPVHFADPFGVITEGPGLVAFTNASFPPPYRFTAGETYMLQCLFRTPTTSSCGTRFNATNAVEVTFQP